MIECATNEVKPSADKAVGRQPSADTADPDKKLNKKLAKVLMAS